MDNQKQVRAEVLSRHIKRLETRIQALDALDHRFFLARLITLIAGSSITVLALFFGPGRTGLAAMAASIVTFALVVFMHHRVESSRIRFNLAFSLATTQLARMRLNWDGLPAPLPVRLDSHHPFARDLDLVGERSLHQLIDTASSQGGSQRLSMWLLNPNPDTAQIQQRQELLREMLLLTGFRNRLSFKGMFVKEDIGGYWQGEALLRWLKESPAPQSLIPALMLLAVLAIINIILFIQSALTAMSPYWTISFLLYTGIYFYKYPSYKYLFQDVYRLGEPLNQFRMVLEYLEKYPYPISGQLAKLCEPFYTTERRPSRYLRTTAWITSAAGLGNHPLISLLVNAVVPWNLYFAFVLERHKAALSQSLPTWLDTWYELEALNSLANFAYLNPTYRFPKIVASSMDEEQAIFKAHDLGHPLIPDQTKVCNDFSIKNLGEIAIISGSNMSGKSTFLRTLGINLCLAYAGGPVNATSLIIIPFRVFTCINVSDSLSDGISYFYAEVRRLKSLLDGLEDELQYPLFFLIDEIFRGTNNRERQIGSRAYLHALARGHGAGAISTHDLELIKLADEKLEIINYHFREDVIDSRMVFDYKLRSGPCPTTNALKIMQIEGLPLTLPNG